MATRSSTTLAGIALAVVIVVAVVTGIWRSVAGRAPDQPAGDPPGPPVATTTAPYEHHEDESDAAEETPGPPPTNVPSTGTDAEEDDELPDDQREVVLRRSEEFWKAFSERDPEARDTALAKVAVPYLARRMSVGSTSRIPVVTPVRSVIVDGTFSQATVVTEVRLGPGGDPGGSTSDPGGSESEPSGSASEPSGSASEQGNSGNDWWYVTLVFDPVPETWSAQAYEVASPGLIAAAKEAMKTEGR